MESLGEGSKVICMGGTVRLMSQSKSLRYSSSFQLLSSYHCIRYFVSCCRET